MLFQQVYGLVDTIIVGRFLGVSALAAVGATGSINFLIIGFCQGICNGFALPIAQRFGARDYDGLRKYVGNSAVLSILFGGTLTVLTVVFCRDILLLMRTPSDIIDLSYQYIVVIFAGIPAFAWRFHHAGRIPDSGCCTQCRTGFAVYRSLSLGSIWCSFCYRAGTGGIRHPLSDTDHLEI